jgi:aminoglycoside phosphotransferase (APT) family kinase protein
VPRLLWSLETGGWVALAFEDVDGRLPAQPWVPDELDRVLDAVVDLAAALTPSPVPPEVAGWVADWGPLRDGEWRRLREDEDGVRPRLDPWSAHHLDALVDLEAGAGPACAGDTLLHLDLRADNLLLTPHRVLVVDWPHARVGAPWLDAVGFAPSVAMQGGPPPEALLARIPAARVAAPEAITAALAAVAGYFTRNALLPPPPGLPTLRPFQDAQGVIAREWLAYRTGWP